MAIAWRRNLLLIVLFASAASLSGCTQKSKVKSAVLSEAQKNFRLRIRSEANKGIEGKDVFKQNYVNLIMRRTKFQIESITVNGDSATVRLNVVTVPPQARHDLVEIIERKKHGSAYGFNVSDALDLIEQHRGLARTDVDTLNLRYSLNRQNGKWLVMGLSQ